MQPANRTVQRITICLHYDYRYKKPRHGKIVDKEELFALGKINQYFIINLYKLYNLNLYDFQ